MEEMLNQPLPISRAEYKKYSLYQSVVVKALMPMTEGRMRLTLPDGETISLGSGSIDIKANIRIVRSIFFKKCVLYGDIGFGESYVDGDWETDDIARVIAWFLLNVENSPTLSGTTQKFSATNILKILNRWIHRSRENTMKRARKNIAEHYDLSNDFFKTFLDPGMTYSSAYFRSSDLSLQEAQFEKYDRLCRQLKIKPTDRVLEIGSGWGGFAVHAARHYGCHVTTITISEEQHAFARARFEKENLADKITVLLSDYRHVTGQFDKIISIEMLEAVGHKYLRTYFKKCHALLKKDGLLGLQVILCPDARYDGLRKSVDWIQKYIFPGSLLPSVGAINRAVNETGDLYLLDLKNMGSDYARTLSVWRENFNRHLADVTDLGFDAPFIRKWNYYLGYCEAAFRMRNISVAQMVFSRPNNLNV